MPTRIWIPHILAIVAARHKMSVEDLTSRNGTREFAEPRQIAAYLSRRLTGATLAVIARYLHQHHTTVMHGIEKVTSRHQNETEFKAMIDSIIVELCKMNAE